MPGPFDFLQGIGNDISGAEKNVQNSVGGWLKGLLPSQPAQPQNPPLNAPSVSGTPLRGMSPAGGASVYKGPRQMQAAAAMPPQQGGQDLLSQFGEFSKGTGLTSLGQSLVTTDFTKQNNAVNNVAAQLGAARDLAGKDLAQHPLELIGIHGDQQPDFSKIPGMQQVGKAFTDPMGSVTDLINNQVSAPLQYIANPEYWFAEDGTVGKGKMGIFDPTGLVGAIGPGGAHNYLRDVFAPVVKAITGEDVPHTTLYYQDQAKALQAQQQQLQDTVQQLDNNPNRTQADIDAYNAKLAEYQAKYNTYMSAYQKSADWWKNSNVSKTMTVLGQIATTPEGFAAGVATWIPSIVGNPVGTSEGMMGQVQAGVQFIQKLSDQNQRDHMSAQELAAGISNVVSLGGLIFGAKSMFKKGAKPGIDVPEQPSREEVIKGLQEHVPDITNPQDGPVAKAAEIAQSRANSPVREDPQATATRISDLQSSLNIAQEQLHTETDPAMKKALIEQVSGISDEIRSLKANANQSIADRLAAQPQMQTELGQQARTAAEGALQNAGVAPADISKWTDDQILSAARRIEDNPNLATENEIAAIEDELNSRGLTNGLNQLRANSQVSEQTVRAADRERQGEFGPSRVAPEVQPVSAYPDYFNPSTKVLGPNYQFLEPRPQDFSMNATRPTVSDAAEFARLSPTEIRAHLQDTRFEPTTIAKIGGNGWINPDGLAIPVYDSFQHAQFFADAGLFGDNPTQDLMDAGWVKKSAISGGVGFGIRGLNPRNLDLINRAIEADHRTGNPPNGYWVADELTGRPPVSINWQDFVANHFDVAPILAKADRNPQLSVTQGGQIGTKISGETGQAGAPSTTSEGRDRPEGSPQDATLTATLPPLTEGERPVGVWQTGTESAGAISGGSRATQLAAKKALKDAVVEALSTSPLSRGDENAQLLQTLMDGIKKEVDAIPLDQIQKLIDKRNKDFTATFNRVRGKYDLEGYMTQLYYDPKSQSDAFFIANRERAITYNPLKLISASWAHTIADITNQHVSNLKEELAPEQYNALTNYVKQWTKVTQEQLDENTIAEEIAHAYDFDHLMGRDEYFRMILGSSMEWKAAAYRAGLGLSDSGFDNSIMGWLTRWATRPDSVPEAIQAHIFTAITEYRASLFKVYKGAPLAGYTYRVPEVFIHEIRDPSLIRPAADALGKEFEERLRPAIRTYVAQKAARNLQDVNAGSQQGGLAAQVPATGRPGISEGTTGDQSVAPIATGPATAATRDGGRPGSDQTSLNAKQPPSEKKGFLSPEELQVVQRTVTQQALGDLTKAGWPEGVRWENFARALMDPKDRAYPIVKGILDKMPPKTQAVFVKAGEMLTRESIQTGVAPKPFVREPAIADSRVQEELTPERSAPANPEDVAAKIASPQFQYIQKEIAAAEVKIQEAGPIISKMQASGEAQYKIDAEKAGLAGLRAFSQALKNGELYQNAVKIGRDASAREAMRLEELTKASSPVPELEAEPYNGIFLGKKYAGFNEAVAKKIIQRLQWSGYHIPKDKAGNLGFNDFLDGLFAEDRIAEKAYKALPLTFKDYIREKTGYQGIPKRGKGAQVVVKPETGVAPGTEHYINQTDFEGLEKAIAVVPQQGGFISIRHGSTVRNGGAGNKAETLRGQDDIPLSDQGEMQAERLAAAFRGMNISVIYVSPMKRAVDTANAISKTTGAKVIIDPNLGPQNIGDYAGKPADVYGKLLAEQAVNRPDEPAPNGESRNDYLRRFLPAVKKHMADALNLDGITLEINHTTGLKTIKGHIMAGAEGLNVHPDPILSKEEVGPGGIMGLAFKDGRWQIAGDKLTNKFTGEQDFSTGEASQKFDVPPGEKAVMPKPEAVAKTEDPLVTGIKENVKKAQAAQDKAAKIQGEVPKKIDLAGEVDAVAADPSHPANAAAVDAKTLRNLLPEAEKAGGAAYERIKSDYATALQRFTSRMALVAKDLPRAAEAMAPEVTDKKKFDQTAAIAAQLRKKLDKGADPEAVAAEAAKKLGMTLKQARAKMKDKQWINTAESKNWATSYQDLIQGKAGQVVREAKLSNRKQAPTIPVPVDDLLGLTPEERSAPGSLQPPPARIRERVVSPAARKILDRAAARPEPPKEVSGDLLHAQSKKAVEDEHAANKKKNTQKLRKETQELHKEINTPSPNPFVERSQGANAGKKGTDVVANRKERRKAGLEEPGMTDGASGSNPPPPKGPGDILAGWDGPRDHARSFGGHMEDLSIRMDAFLKKLAERTNPGRNTGHPIAQARQYLESKIGDKYRRDGILKTMEAFLGKDIEVHRAVRRAIEGPEDARTEAKKNLTPEQAAFADMWHSYEEVTGRIKSQGDVELIKAAVEDRLAHIVKFDENGVALMDKNGVVRGTGLSSRLKWWVGRSVDPETGEVRFPTIDSLIKEFGEGRVEENLVEIFKQDTGSFINKLRTKEMIDDLSGHYITNDESFRLGPGMFTETKNLGGKFGIPKNSPPYMGRAIVPKAEAADMPDAYRNQLDTINLGPNKGPLQNYLVYKPLKEFLEREASLEDGMNALTFGTGWLRKANGIYKIYKFGFNPIHLFNLLTNMSAMAGKYSPIPDISLYKKIYGRVDEHLTNPNKAWDTPIGKINFDEAVAKIIDAGGVVRDQLIDSANLGGLQGVLARNVPAFKQWHNFMWHDTAWKGQIGLAMHLTDRLTKQFTDYYKQPPNEAEWNNILRLSTLKAKEAMGFLDKTDMSRDWNMIGNTVLFANSWSTVQARLVGKAIPQNVPGAKFLANFGGGEKYNDTFTNMMKDIGGMDEGRLKWINSQDGALSRQFAVGSALKLMAVSTAMAYAGSAIATMSGQQNAQASGPWNNFMRDPTHTFDIYVGTDPATGKDRWLHNPLYGMMQEVINYGMAAIKAGERGGDPYSVATAGPTRYISGKLNPILSLAGDIGAGKELSLFWQGYGDKSDITQDKSVVAIQKALAAKGIDIGGAGFMDNLIYAIRSVGPSPSFAPTIQPSEQVSSWGDIANALGPGKFLGIGDLMNTLKSGNPQFGDMSNWVKGNMGNLAEYMLGSRETLTTTPAQAAQNQQYAQNVATNDAKTAQEQEMVQAAYKGDWKTVMTISAQLNQDSNQMLNTLLHPPAGSGGGLIYHNTPYQPPATSATQDTLQGVTLNAGQSAELEGLKKINTIAMYNELAASPEWQSATNPERASMISSIEAQVTRAVNNQYAQKIGLLGGAPITSGDIQSMITAELGLRNVAAGTLANNPYYISADPVAQQRMMSEYKTFADQLAWDSTFGTLKGTPPERVQMILDAAVQTEEGTRKYLTSSIFYQMASVDEKAKMVSEYSTLARTVAKRYALGEGQGTGGDIQLTGRQLLPAIQKTITIEETAKSLLHGTDYYQTSDTAAQASLDSKYSTLARTLAFTPSPIGDPNIIINNSITAEQSYFDLQNNFGGANYVKLMAQQLSDLEATMRQGADYTPAQIAAMQRNIRAGFLAQNPSYAAYLKAKTWWGRNTTDGQIYNALSNSEFAAVDDLAQQDVQPTDSVLTSGVSSDPYFDPSSSMGLSDLGLGTLSPTGSLPSLSTSLDAGTPTPAVG